MFFFLDFLGGVILHRNLIASKNQFTNKKSQRKVATLRKNDAFCSCLGTNYYTLRPQLGHVHTFDRNAYVFVPCASFRYNFGELFFKIVTKEKPSFNVLFIPYFCLLVFGILVSLVACFSFRFFLSCPSCLAKCKQRLCSIFILL